MFCELTPAGRTTTDRALADSSVAGSFAMIARTVISRIKVKSTISAIFVGVFQYRPINLRVFENINMPICTTKVGDVSIILSVLLSGIQ